MRLISFLLLAFFLISFVSAVVPDDCDSNMISYWQFENNVLDGYGDYDDGYWQGTERYNSLVVGDALYFPAGSENVVVPNIDSFTSRFTIEFWLKSSMSLDSSLLKKGDLDIRWVSGIPLSSVVADIDTTTVEALALDSMSSHHVALVWASSEGKLKLYVDGSNVDEADLFSVPDTTGNLVIGDGFKGLIDELAIYDTDLSESIIRSHYYAGLEGEDYCDDSGAGGSSSTETEFNIDGCNFIGDGSDVIGVSRGACSIGDYEGRFYCSESLEALYTNESNSGCAMEAGDDYNVGDNGDICCPPGYGCTGNKSSGFKCERRLANCFDQTTEAECHAIDCIWIEDVSKCVDSYRDLSCSDYATQEDCESDDNNIGLEGIGTELCGDTIYCDDTYFSVFCGCVWDETAEPGDQCRNEIEGRETIYGATQKVFGCFNVYTPEEDCTDGRQTVSWTSTESVAEGFGNSAGLDECKEELGCNSGSYVRFCGEPIVKLPGFSLFAFFMSLFVIVTYYFVSKNGVKFKY